MLRGAYYGEEGIPAEWRDKLVLCEKMLTSISSLKPYGQTSEVERCIFFPLSRIALKGNSVALICH